MTDPAIVMRKLAALREHAERIRRRLPATAEALRSDVDLQDALSMSLLVTVQAALDIAMHIAADDKLGLPSTYAESFALLAQHQIVPADTCDQLSRMAALRNRIAHGYASVDFARIWSELPAGLRAFEAFAIAVARHLQSGAGS
jgi:uncharacterized protein YutE (UPF0331/DUF86 family)